MPDDAGDAPLEGALAGHRDADLRGRTRGDGEARPLGRLVADCRHKA